MFPFGHAGVFPAVTETRYLLLELDSPTKGEIKVLDPNGRDTKTMSLPENDKGEELRDAWHRGEEAFFTLLQVRWESNGEEHYEEAITAVTTCNGCD